MHQHQAHEEITLPWSFLLSFSVLWTQRAKRHSEKSTRKQDWLLPIWIRQSCPGLREACYRPYHTKMSSRDILKRFWVQRLWEERANESGLLFSLGVRFKNICCVTRHDSPVSVEQKKLKLDEKLITYLPYFKLNDPNYKNITCCVEDA